MRVPSYRKHSSGQARVTINGKDHLLGKYGSPKSKELYGRMIAEWQACNRAPSFGKVPETLLLQDVLLDFSRFAKKYYQNSGEAYHYTLTARPLVELYARLPAKEFGPVEYKAVREWWLSDKSRSRQYVNKMMKRTVRIIKWAVGEGMMPTQSLVSIRCVDPLRRGRCEAKESKKIKPVDRSLVEATIKLLTQVQADMIRFQQLTGCRPGEVCAIKPKMVDRSGDVWLIRLEEHKTAHRDRDRTLYVGPKAQAVLAPYLLRGQNDNCFSPAESEKQRRWTRHLERKAGKNCGNRPGYSKRTRQARKPQKEPGTSYDATSYAKFIKYACKRGKLESWSPNQIRHSRATEIRRDYGLDAAQVILGHSELSVTQVYAETDKAKAIEVAKLIG